MAAKILVIDDDKIMLHLIKAILGGDGYRVMATHEPAKGLDWAFLEQPDLITLDIHMPSPDGWEILTRLRSSPLTQNIPVLMLTAKDSLENVVVAYKRGANDYLAKPIDPKILRNRVSHLIAGRGPE